MKNAVLIIMLLVTSSVFSDIISKKEQAFWDQFSKQDISLLQPYADNGFIKGNYWFGKHPIVEAFWIGWKSGAEWLIENGIKQTIEINESKSQDVCISLIGINSGEGAIYLLNKRKIVTDEIIEAVIRNSKSTVLIDLVLALCGDINKYIVEDIQRSRDYAGPIDTNYLYTFASYAAKNNNIVSLQCVYKAGGDVNSLSYGFKPGRFEYGAAVPFVFTTLDLVKGNIKQENEDRYKPFKPNEELLKYLISISAKEFVIDNVLEYPYLKDLIKEIERKGYYFIARRDVKLYELPREKSFVNIEYKNVTKIYLIDRYQTGTEYTWYFVVDEGLNIGWIKNNNIWRFGLLCG